MKQLPIRLKLTAWYVVVLLASLSVFGVTAFFAMRKGIEHSVDEGLEEQAGGIEELARTVLKDEPLRLADELREHAELRAEGDFSQVCDQTGRWIYRSPLMANYNIPMPNAASNSVYTFETRGLPLRILVRDFSIDGDSYRIQVAAPMDDFYEALSRFKWILFLLSPLLLVLASGGGYWLSRRALIPVDKITRTAQEINSNNLSQRLEVPQSGDELQRLSETLNGMLERLEAAFNRITQFTADASHELRTPLALMRTATEVSLRTSKTISEYRETQAELLEELEKTSDLVEKLMLLARADAGGEALQRSRVNLVDCLRDACNEGRILAEAKQITFREDLTSPVAAVNGDSHALHRLFLILIDNAVKYTPCGGSIAVCLSTGGRFVEVEVRDTGIGISPEDLPHIFERFYRADKARSREFGGVGLGLSIAQWVAEAHSGSLEAQCAPGKGSVFKVHLPTV